MTRSSITANVGETGYVAVSSSALDAAMERANPMETFAALEASLNALLPAMPQAKMNTIYPETGGATFQFLGYAPLPSNVGVQALSQSLTLVKRSLKPMSESNIAALLTEMRCRVMTRKEDALDVVLQIRVYAKDLTAWPADIVRYVLSTWHERSDYFPTGRELIVAMERWNARRKGLVAVLESALNAPCVSPPNPGNA